MEKTIDARGQACPKPLVMARDTLKTLTQDDKLNVVVDNWFLHRIWKNGKPDEFTISKSTARYRLYSIFVRKKIHVHSSTRRNKCEVPTKTDNSFVVVVSSNVMGHGDDKLGSILIKGFIYSLTCLETLPKAVIFIIVVLN